MIASESSLKRLGITHAQARLIEIALRDGFGLCEGMYGAALCSIDGHELIHEFVRELSSSRLAAMNSSILALAETLAAEAEQQVCKFVILENSNGRLVTLRVNKLLLLTCIANHESNLGVFLKVSRDTASGLASILSDD